MPKMLKQVMVSVDSDLKDQLDALIVSHQYGSKNEMLKDLVVRGLEASKNEKDNIMKKTF